MVKNQNKKVKSTKAENGKTAAVKSSKAKTKTTKKAAQAKQNTAQSAPITGRDRTAAQYAEKRKARGKKFVLQTVAIVFLCAILAFGTTAFAYVVALQTRLSNGLDAGLQTSLKQVADGEPFYMLLLGIDKDEERAHSSNYGPSDSAFRTDSMMLARIDPKDKQVTLVSLHRDTLVDLGKNGKQKINAAYPCGGPSYTVDVVSQFAGVPISHYAEIDFDQFSSIVDALGGIKIDVPIDINDPHVGAPIKKGEQILNGTQALELCRSRHAYDNYGDGDIYRAANQRMVIEQIFRQLLAADPATMAATVQQCASAVTTDLSVAEILALANDMRGIDIDNNVYTGMEPTSSLYANNTWFEVCNIPAWRTMMMRVNKGLSPYSSADQDPTQGNAGGKLNIKNDGTENDEIYNTSNTGTNASSQNSSTQNTNSKAKNNS